MANNTQRKICGRYTVDRKPFARGAYGSVFSAQDKEAQSDEYSIMSNVSSFLKLLNL